jgi:putative ATP-dependent endonuclease of OLD family
MGLSMGRAAKKTLSPDSVEQSATTSSTRPRVHKLIIRNFRCIGSKGVEILLDDIVVLVGANNVGKSSILHAYKLIMSEGSKGAVLTQDDFPDGRIDEAALPEIELETVVFDNAPGDQWIRTDEDGTMFVRERWQWQTIGEPVRQGWDVKASEWSAQRPWGAANVAKARRPQPHRVDAFEPPDKQVAAIIDLLQTIVKQRLTAYTATEGTESEKSHFQQLLDQLANAQRRVVNDSREEVSKVETELGLFIKEIFPGYEVTFDAQPEENLTACITFFKQGSRLLLGPENGYKCPVEKQGSGARRTLLWTALRLVADDASGKKAADSTTSRPQVLLIDEPEICLHPTAIRDACRVLYDLPKSYNWQVMATTHSPAFIDVSRDNTTIIRVERDTLGQVYSTTVFRPEKARLDTGDKERLKLLNVYDPYVAEFFFGGKNIIVEGDTEYSAFKHVIAAERNRFKDVHIIRARGKATIVTLVKILNQFGAAYSVLHDSDTPLLDNGNNNSAWTLNEKILDETKLHPIQSRVMLVASSPNFEGAFLGTKTTREKPYAAVEALKSDTDAYSAVRSLLTALVEHKNELLPMNAVPWTAVDDLVNALSRTAN